MTLHTPPNPSPRNPVRTAVLGFGKSGHIFHAPFLAADPAFELTAVVTSNDERRAQALAEYPRVRVLPDAESVFSAVADFDLVVIGTPSGTHEELAARAIDAGLHVVVDKPFALSSAVGRRLIEKAKQAGTILTVFQNRRWDGDFRTVAKLIDSGRLGEIRHFDSRFEWWKPNQGLGEQTWKVTSGRESGGGLLFDLGSHVIDQAVQLFGPAEEVYAEIDYRRPGMNAEDDVFLALRHGSGVRSHLWMSAVAPWSGPRFHVTGADAAYTSWGLDPQEAQLIAGLRPGDPEFAITPEKQWGTMWQGGAAPNQTSNQTPNATGGPEVVPTLPGDYADFYRILGAAITAGGPLPVDPADAVHTLEIIEQAVAYSRQP